jgi:DNA-binding NarL/FixJ family response regulator
MPLDEVISEALGVADPVTRPIPVPSLEVSLTPREIDVLRLLAAGLQDRQIAEALFISTRTASFHVANLLAKLEVESRSAAAAYAVRNGIA